MSNVSNLTSLEQSLIHISRQELGGEWGDDCGRDPCLPTCTTDVVIAHQDGFYDTFGSLHKMTGQVCGAGSAARQYTSSYSWSISLQVGPDLVSFEYTCADPQGFAEEFVQKGILLKDFTNLVDKIGIRVGGSYSWG